MAPEIDRLLDDLDATAAVARALALAARPGDVICLYGDLGAGKTTFARGFLRALGVVEEVPSPTFNLVLTYDTAAGPVWHFDLFRLTGAAEAHELGIEEAFANGISLIEWPERLGPLLPDDRIEVHLEPGPSDRQRRIRLRGLGRAAGRDLQVTA
ncbi:MAG: tRNA (adenosine(37)-N6)-threonylcarbamoyltransferase complex ATPase subunit type 1 TsaE [Alphaproteobacteria bacterium]|jgi:tRNA threonylcarbamoyladenosine biosynthesis protein TsaE|nr:tRNA (adenosine(37)-N6)-threonylcarbamoyltransferase complex ATPase subunit type 1 TsaE [Alphaproteobacteria bacterium]MDP6567854.1 tRNA (adenosine(37)-N6)-threonylcarbamoyltransferase complex ATPase subunit type 1 TsaE [Alphaproteobacteria bacterium]MDP6816209.1 tRNA (adenosine(37)-N6)-threonylcarbamoyltransferase complex ATPase subunit type 1 TsaE [Alphaproteobacteria bacterium]